MDLQNLNENCVFDVYLRASILLDMLSQHSFLFFVVFKYVVTICCVFVSSMHSIKLKSAHLGPNHNNKAIEIKLA